MQKVVEVGAPKVAIDAFTRHNQLGLQPSSIQVSRIYTQHEYTSAQVNKGQLVCLIATLQRNSVCA